MTRSVASEKRGDVVYTPDWVAHDMVDHFAPCGRILEPCRGAGAFTGEAESGQKEKREKRRCTTASQHPFNECPSERTHMKTVTILVDCETEERALEAFREMTTGLPEGALIGCDEASLSVHLLDKP